MNSSCWGRKLLDLGRQRVPPQAKPAIAV